MAQVKASARCEVPPNSRQNATLKFQHLMLEALISKRMSVIVKNHLENIVAKQLRELVTKIFMELMFSSDLLQKLEEIKASRESPPDEQNLSDSLPLEQLHLEFEPEEIPLLYSTKALGDQLAHPIKVALVNESREVVYEGKEASAMLELLVLRADSSEKFTTLEEFRKAELKPRENKPPLLHGETRIQLVNGRGMVDTSLRFTDNSSWVTPKTICLGLVPLSTQSRIQGAQTKAFLVQDRRSAGNQKHKNPNSSSSLWQFPGVGKHGKCKKQLEKMKIVTAGDFVACLKSNPEELRKIFRKESDFEALVKSTKKCTANTTTENLVQGGLSQPKNYVENHNSNLVGPSSSRSLVARGKTYPAGQTEALSDCSLTEAPSQSFIRGVRGYSCDQFQNQFDWQERSSIQAMFAESNMPKECLDCDGQGRVMIRNEADPERGEYLEAQRDRNQQGSISSTSNRPDMLGSCSSSFILRPIIYSAGLSRGAATKLPAEASDSRTTKRTRVQTHDQDSPSIPDASGMSEFQMPSNPHNVHYPEAHGSAVVVFNPSIIGSIECSSEGPGYRNETPVNLDSILMDDDDIVLLDYDGNIDACIISQGNEDPDDWIC